jgi:hypothetical protein
MTEDQIAEAFNGMVIGEEGGQYVLRSPDGGNLPGTSVKSLSVPTGHAAQEADETSGAVVFKGTGGDPTHALLEAYRAEVGG